MTIIIGGAAFAMGYLVGEFKGHADQVSPEDFVQVRSVMGGQEVGPEEFSFVSDNRTVS